MKQMIFFSLILATLQISEGLTQVSRNTTLIGNLEYAPDRCNSGGFCVNDVWGYTDEQGNDYAIVGNYTGVSIVAVDSSGVQEIAFIPGASSIWRDIKTHGNYAYVTNESNSGLAIIDLSDLPNSARFVKNYSTDFSTAHNLYIADGYAYIAGSSNAQGADILDLSDPESPVKVGEFDTFYLHDIYVQENILYGSAANRSRLSLVDVTNKSAPQLITEITFPDGGYMHNAWSTEDGNYVMTTQETSGLTVKMWDIRDFNNPILVDEYLSSPSLLAHNTHILGDYAYLSHYGDGLRILDIAVPEHMVEVGHYDTHLGASSGFDGNWGAFPFTNSGYIYVSDESEGLFVVSFNGRRASRLNGKITDAESGETISDVTISVAGISQTRVSDFAGNYKFGFPDPGSFILQAYKFGYDTTEVAVTLSEGQTQILNISMSKVGQGSVSGMVVDENGNGVSGAQIFLPGTPIETVTTNSDGSFALTGPAGTYTSISGKWGFRNGVSEVTILSGQNSNAEIILTAGYADNFELDLGWQVSDGSANFDGPWRLEIPENIGLGLPFHPAADVTPSPGVQVFFGRTLGTQLSIATPSFDLTKTDGGTVRFSLFWFPRGNNGDLLSVQISNDNGLKYQEIAQFGDPDATQDWTEISLDIPDGLQRTSEMRIRFLSSETADFLSSFALVDEFEILDLVTSVADEPVLIPKTYSLGQNYPNPFNAGTVIRYSLPENTHVQLSVFNIIGERIQSLVDAEQSAGNHQIKWDGRDETGRNAASGIYFYRIETTGFTRTHKMVLTQ